MPGAQDEPVAVRPVRARRVVSQHLRVEEICDRGERHRRSRVAGVRLLDGVHRQRPDRVDGELLDLRVGQRSSSRWLPRERNGYDWFAAPARISSLRAASSSSSSPVRTAAIVSPRRRKRYTARSLVEVTLELGRVVAGGVAEGLEAAPELLGEERRDDVVAGVLVAGEHLAERRTVVGRVRPVLDAAVPPIERVVELCDVADRVHALARGAEALVDDDAAAHLEAGVAAELDVRLDADACDHEVGIGDVASAEAEVDAVLAVAIVERRRKAAGSRARGRARPRGRPASPAARAT